MTALPANAVPPPPTNPSDSQIQASEQHATASAEQVGKLSGQVSTTQAKIQQLQDAMELKAELAMKAQVDLQTAQEQASQAEHAATTAQQAATKATGAITTARADAAEFAAASYRQGYVLGSMAAFLDVSSMDQLVARQQLIDQVSGSQRGVMAALASAQSNKANLDSQAKAALDAAHRAQAQTVTAAKAADAAKQAAAQAFQQGQQQLTALQNQLTAQQSQYQTALNTVADLKGQRAQYNAWEQQKQQEEQRLNEQAALQAAQAAQAQQQQLAQQQLAQQQAAAKNAAVGAEQTKQLQIQQAALQAAAARRAAAARQAAANQAAANQAAANQAAANQAAASSNSSGPAQQPAPQPAPAPAASGSSGSSLAIGERVAQAALAWVGTPYAWGGGNAYGPTRGIHDWGVADSFGDYKKIGFDCSGLALYAWAQVGVYLPHYSAYQYNYGTRVSLNNLQPGDLLFYATNIYDPATIHHVAIYIGNGQMVQAPESGSYVSVAPLRTYGFIGATRPGA